MRKSDAMKNKNKRGREREKERKKQKKEKERKKEVCIIPSEDHTFNSNTILLTVHISCYCV